MVQLLVLESQALPATHGAPRARVRTVLLEFGCCGAPLHSFLNMPNNGDV